ncbi:MAG: carbamoyl-phosphate synthase large subunit [Clostridia bacterium]|nr:carbamoyl-phosphate synthase large subunit [Clostridia bacterium]
MSNFKKVLVIGSGAVVIGQSSEYDYSAVIACKALKDEGIEVVMVNPNPVTIATDNGVADKTYLEPLSTDVVKRIIKAEKVDGILPTVGGDIGFKIGLELSYNGYLEDNGITLLGVNPDIISTISNRKQFKDFLSKIGEPEISSKVVSSVKDAVYFANQTGYPVIVRPAYTLGGDSTVICENEAKLETMAKRQLDISSIGQIFVEKCVSGWKEIEFEVVRDCAGNCISVCSMENIDSVGIHTGDSIVVIPAQTLNDSETSRIRAAALHIANEIGIEGSCNIQIALKPDGSEYVILGMSPRVGRTSALVSKATGYPIAEVSAKIALGYKLFEIKNNTTGCTTACNEPAIDYCAVKMPKWSFKSFEMQQRKLGTSMQATGETLCIGTSFEMAFLKAIRSIELDIQTPSMSKFEKMSEQQLNNIIIQSDDERIFAVYEAIKRGISFDTLYNETSIDYWFLSKLKNIADMEKNLSKVSDVESFKKAKQMGFTNATISKYSDISSFENIHANFNTIDTCAAEFDAQTPYFYSAWDDDNEAKMYDDAVKSGKKKVLVVGAGPSSIGQGIELDYAVVNIIKDLKASGFETIMVNNNPEAVSTDLATADKLYLEPLSVEDITNILKTEKPFAAVTQFAGEKATEITKALESQGVKILGANSDVMELTDDKIRFNALLDEIGIPHRSYMYTNNLQDALDASAEIGFPVSVKTSFDRCIAYNSSDLKEFISGIDIADEKILIEKYFIGVGIDIYAICDGDGCLVPCIYEHIERAGVNAGDSISVSPPITLPEKVQQKVVDYAVKLSKKLGVKGIFNIEFIFYDNDIYLIHARPDEAKGLPFVSKATGLKITHIASHCALGESLSSMGYSYGILEKTDDTVAVRVPVFSFDKISGIDTQLGIGAKSTGEVMGIASNFEDALLKALVASGMRIKKKGGLLITVRDADKQSIIAVADKFAQLGFSLYATAGTAKLLNENCVATNSVRKIHEGSPNIADLLGTNKIDYVISTSTRGQQSLTDDIRVRRKAVERGIPTFTSLDTANALARCLFKNRSLDDIEIIDIYNKGE